MESLIALIESVLPATLADKLKSIKLTEAQESLITQSAYKILQLVMANAPALLQQSVNLLATLTGKLLGGGSLQDSTEEAPDEATLNLNAHAEAITSFNAALKEFTDELEAALGIEQDAKQDA